MSCPQAKHSAGRAELIGEWIASRPGGQFLFRCLDGVLRNVEKCLMWSAQPVQPSGDMSENGSGTSLMPMTRPLPWLVFIPVIGFLSVIRASVYCITRVFRKPYDTKDMIHWLQDKRCHLRAIRKAGINNSQLNGLSTPSRTRASIISPNSKSPTIGVAVGDGESPDKERKRKFCDVEQSDLADSSDDEGVAVKLEKYTENYNSDEDPDYVLNSEEDSSEDDDSDSSEEEEDLVPVSVADVLPSITSNPVDTTLAVPKVIVEPVSENGNTGSESSPGSLTSPFSVRAKSKFVKFFKPSNKAKQQL